MTRPPWWTAHVVGLALLQLAFWFGFWQLSDNKPFVDALADATVMPLYGMMVVLPCTVVFQLMVWYTIIFRAWDSNPKRRSIWFLLSYLLLAGNWCLGARVGKFLASPQLLMGPLD